MNTGKYRYVAVYKPKGNILLRRLQHFHKIVMHLGNQVNEFYRPPADCLYRNIVWIASSEENKSFKTRHLLCLFGQVNWKSIWKRVQIM